MADTQRELSRVPAAAARISDARDQHRRHIGRTLFLTIRHGDMAVQDYVTLVGRKVAGRARREFDYRFHYVPSDGLVELLRCPEATSLLAKDWSG